MSWRNVFYGQPWRYGKVSWCLVFLLLLVLGGTTACAMDSVPVVTLEVRVEEGEQAELEQFMNSFASARDFSVIDRSRESSLAGGRRVSAFRFTRADGVAMGLGDYLDGKRFWVAIYDDRETHAWHKLYRELETQLKSRWPDTVIEHGPVEDQR